MAETENPVEALSAREIPVRAAAARDLALVGGLTHVGRLINMAIHDPSPGVRLNCAAAAADILSRYRVPPRSAELTEAQRRVFLQQLTSDPTGNAGLFQICGVLDLPEGRERVFRALRDPRVDVRTGGCVGLLRMCLSAAVNGDAAIEQKVLEASQDVRVRVETRIEITHIAAQVGYRSLLPIARQLAALGGRPGEAAEAVLKVFEVVPAVNGIYVDHGLDAGEVNPEAKAVSLHALLCPERGPCTLVSLPADGEGVVTVATWVGPLRHLRVPQPKQDAVLAVQLGSRTLFQADNDEIATLGDAVAASNDAALVSLLEPLWPESAVGLRVRGVLKLAIGDVTGALALLQAAVELKRVPNDTFWFLADALRRLGRDAEARPHLERYVSKANRKSPYLAQARALLGDVS